MFFPIHDENKLRSIKFQYMTVALIAINVLVFFLEISGMQNAIIASFAVVPRELFEVSIVGGAAPSTPDTVAVPEAYTLITYMFLHDNSNPLHLIGNMVFLWVFGDNVEDAVGHVKFLIFYLLCGIAAGLVQALMAPSSEAPLIGASGAVAGVIAAYLMLHPRVMVWGMAFKVIPLRITAAMALGLWIAYQFVMVLVPSETGIAWWAHIGGLAAGAILIVFMRRPGVPLFDRGLAA